MLTRRELNRGLVAGLGLAQLGALPALAAGGATKAPPKTKRVVFFLQNHGFDPLTCIPRGVGESCALASLKLEEPMRDLEPYKSRMHVLIGLHGKHTAPHHSAFYGALGGYRGGYGVPPAAATIDSVLSGHLPECIFPHLAIGMESLDAMRARPTEAALSAAGVGKPIYMESNPILLYQKIFGSIANKDLKAEYAVESTLLKQLERFATEKATGLPSDDAARYATYVEGYQSLNASRDKLAAVPDVLKKFAPKFDQRYTHPENETDWHDALLEIGIAALQANLTNVLTIGSGRGDVSGSWHGLGVEQQGHNLGHLNQPGNADWTKIRKYNCQMLVKLIKALEAIPEGRGTMMDNTLIVYTSNNADKQHTKGLEWPFVLIGNGGGAFKTGRLTHCKGRPINDLYTTFLRGLGEPVDRFNLKTGNLVQATNSKSGPIEEVLA